MKLTELLPSTQPGTYAAVLFDDQTVKHLRKFCEDHKIPNRNDDWHVTLLFSRKHLPNFKPITEYQQPMTASPTGFEVWPTSSGKKNVLVLTLYCPELYQRHHKLMLQHGATYDFDEYKPHVSFSYNIGDFDISQLPQFDQQLTIVGEYSSQLDAD